jgi:predicted double-glycine peptidase
MAACAVDEQIPPVRSLLETRQDQVIAQKWDISCGAAALATLLTYQLGDPVTEQEVARSMLNRTDPLRVKHRGGFSLLDLKRYAQSRGYEADGYSDLSVEDLQQLAPLIVPMRARGYDHFVVFRGLVGDRVVLADPGFGNSTMSVPSFEGAWNGNVGFVVRRPNTETPNRVPPRHTDFVAPSNEVVRSALRLGTLR